MLAEIIYDGQLSGSAYVVLIVILLIILGGLAWCFYRAVKAGETDEEQLPGEE